jgi:hypothetical protein
MSGIAVSDPDVALCPERAQKEEVSDAPDANSFGSNEISLRGRLPEGMWRHGLCSHISDEKREVII